MKIAVGFFALIFLLSAFIEKKDENKMQSFKWLIGSWTMNTNRGAIMETWIQLNDSTISGESIFIKITGGTEQREKLRFIYSNKEYFYCVTFLGQNNNEEIKFRITSFADSSFVSENLQHDFPRRIIYKLTNKDTIHAVVDDGEIPKKKFDFFYSRYKN